jgi:LmbE family N-acetylglucosaminyl deacetylase
LLLVIAPTIFKLIIKELIMEKTALAIVAHPDDAEFLCAGTFALLHQKGWRIHISTMTAGDCGSKNLKRSEISEIRKKEAANSAKILDAGYHCLGLEDLFITYDKPAIVKTVALIRQVRPQVVFTMSPSCYMLDHEITCQLVQSACFGGGLVNVDTPGIDPIDFIPYLYYADAMEGKDKFGQKINATTIIDISSVMQIKTDMLGCHKSQREWLRQHHGMDEYILSMQRQSKARGEEISVLYAEGFRQHLGHAYPQDNILLKELPEYTHIPQ